MEFKAPQGCNAAMSPCLTDGKPVPFAAEDHDANGNVLDVSGHSDIVSPRGMDNANHLAAHWDEAHRAEQKHSSHYALPASRLLLIKEWLTITKSTRPAPHRAPRR